MHDDPDFEDDPDVMNEFNDDRETYASGMNLDDEFQDHSNYEMDEFNTDANDDFGMHETDEFSMNVDMNNYDEFEMTDEDLHMDQYEDSQKHNDVDSKQETRRPPSPNPDLPPPGFKWRHLDGEWELIDEDDEKEAVEPN